MTPATPFSRLLIANRGEIAMRILRSARRAGLETVAVHTDADGDAPHLALADRVIRIGAGPAGESYLNAERLLEAAAESGADALHPGYGFLSENADFAAAVAAAGLVFVGPPASAIAAMGDKAEAKRLMQAAGVPCLAGYEGADQSDHALAEAARAIGWPLMVKAAAGGGGRGMRLVRGPDDLPRALDAARREAAGAFGSDRLILERALLDARHVEIQVFADRHGGLIHLGERDCSLQRRHQKVIEEAPSPALDAELRVGMGRAAIAAAAAIGYEGAGTVEFLLEADGAFHFLEMNTRLQVEHPVTEMVTGLDLVDMQLKIAAGQPLGLAQDDVVLSGHAIEARLYAEDPARDFLPGSGRIAHWREPEGDGVRVDSGVAEGSEVSPLYDPLLAKIIAHGPDRDTARLRLIAALARAPLFGPENNRDFLIRLLSTDDFTAGRATTGYLDAHLSALAPAPPAERTTLAALAALALRDAQAGAQALARSSPELLGWGSPGALTSRLRIREGDRRHRLTTRLSPEGGMAVTIESEGENGGAAGRAGAEFTRDRLEIDGERLEIAAFLRRGDSYFLATPWRSHHFQLERPGARDAARGAGGSLVAPMHGLVREIATEIGARVNKGQRLVVLEAMKMQHDLLAETAGTVTALFAAPGRQVAAGDPLVEIDPAPEPDANGG